MNNFANVEHVLLGRIDDLILTPGPAGTADKEEQ
jgi:hypothetical protein